ncbi:MAG: hypothetical protein AAF149_20520 [Bacteroidota bacterium]
MGDQTLSITKSFLTEEHFYYCVVLKPEFEITFDAFVSKFCADNPRDTYQDNENIFVHTQMDFDDSLGAESKMIRADRRSMDGKDFYKYDFLLTHVKTGRYGSLFLVCFPYKQLQSRLSGIIPEIWDSSKFIKARVDKVVSFFKKNDFRRLTSESKKYLVEISKYTAVVDELGNEKKGLQIAGTNPLISKVYRILQEAHNDFQKVIPDLKVNPKSFRVIKNEETERFLIDEGNKKAMENALIITPKALKLDFSNGSKYRVDLHVDFVGNYRFWIRKKSLKKTMFALPGAIRYLSEADVLFVDSFLSKLGLHEI